MHHTQVSHRFPVVTPGGRYTAVSPLRRLHRPVAAVQDGPVDWSMRHVGASHASNPPCSRWLRQKAVTWRFRRYGGYTARWRPYTELSRRSHFMPIEICMESDGLHAYFDRRQVIRSRAAAAGSAKPPTRKRSEKSALMASVWGKLWTP